MIGNPATKALQHKFWSVYCLYTNDKELRLINETSTNKPFKMSLLFALQEFMYYSTSLFIKTLFLRETGTWGATVDDKH